MSRQIGLLIALAFGGFLAAGQQSLPLKFHSRREAANDLEIRGLVKSVPPGESQFVSRESLESLPQIAVTIQSGKDFNSKGETQLRVKGIYLDVLAKSLGAANEAAAAAAICSDGYTSTFSKQYIQNHRPVFVLTVEGLTPHDWAVKNHDFDAGPYFIGYENFVPAFQVLAHVDQPQEPDGMTKIDFDTDDRLFAGIAPKQPDVSKEVLDGAKIAQQNCYRCHNSGSNGGTKAGVSWSQIGAIAKKRPEYFSAWVHDPHVIKPTTSMPANLEYDQATLNALDRYFATFALKER